jgi:ankyrin repeat protein
MSEKTLKRDAKGNIKAGGRGRGPMLLGIGGELFSDEMLRSLHKTLFENVYKAELAIIKQYESQMGTLDGAISARSFGERLNRLCSAQDAMFKNTSLLGFVSGQMLLNALYHRILATHDDFKWDQDFIANDDLWTVLQLQASKNHVEVCEWLINHGANLHYRESKGYTALAIAAARNAEKTVRLLLDLGADPTEVSDDQTTALHLAASSGHEDVVSILCKKKHGVSLNAVNDSGMTPLLLAAQNKHTEVVRVLLECAASQENGKQLILEMLSKGTKADWTPLHFACWFGEEKIVRLLLEAECLARGLDVVMAPPQEENKEDDDESNNEQNELVDQRGFLTDMTAPLVASAITPARTAPVTVATSRTALFGSASSRVVREVSVSPTMQPTITQEPPAKKRIVDATAVLSPPSNQPATNATVKPMPAIKPHPMALAGGNGHTECIKVLMEYGVKVDERNPADNTTALHSSITGSHLDTVKFLLEKGADVMLPTKTGVNALMLAAGQKTREYLDVIFLCKPSIDVNAEVKGWSAVMSAASKGRLENLKFLIEEKGGSLTNLSKNNFTLLQLAAQDGHLDVVKWLWAQTKTGLNHVNKFGWTPLYCAAFHGHAEVVDYLLGLGADPFLDSKDGWTVIMLLARVGNNAALQRVLAKIPDSELKTRINSATFEKWTALHSAASRNHPKTVKILLENGGDMLQKDARGWMPLACAVQQGHVEVVKTMLEFASKNNLLQRAREVHDALKVSLVHLAAASKNCQDPEMINVLLQYGFDAAPRKQFATPESDKSKTPYFKPKSPAVLAVEHGKNKAFIDALFPWSDDELLKDAKKIEDLLTQNPSLAIAVNKDEENVLHLAFRAGHLESAKVLMEHLRLKGSLTRSIALASISDRVEDKPYLSPIHLAIMNRQHSAAFLEAIQMCMVNGLLPNEKIEDVMNAQDNFRRTPLFLAVLVGDAEWVQTLINTGAQITTIGKTENGSLLSPLALAQQLKESATPEEKVNREKIAALLVSRAEDLRKESINKQRKVFAGSPPGPRR